MRNLDEITSREKMKKLMNIFNGKTVKYNLLKSIKKEFDHLLIGSVDANRRKWTRNKIAINIM